MICNIEAEPSGDKILYLDDALPRQHLARLLDDTRSGIMDACARTRDASLPLQPTDFIHPRKDLIRRHEVGVFAFSGRSRKQHRFHFVHDVGWHEHRINANTAELRAQAVFFVQLACDVRKHTIPWSNLRRTDEPIEFGAYR